MDNYNKAIELDPTLPDAYNNRGEVYLEQKQYSQAIDNYTQAIELDPTLPDAYQGRSKAYTALGDTERAAEDEKRYRELTSGSE
jgi:tetratricopeptide (TPR) repeat protein